MKPTLPLVLLTLLAAPAVIFTARAQNAPPALTREAPAPAGYVDFNADKSVFDDQKGIGLYTGDVTATQTGEDFILYAQEANSFRAQNTATATKDLRIETRDSTIRGEKLFANFNTKVFSLSGSVVVSSYGPNDGVQTANSAKIRAQNNRKPVRIACERLDWNYDTRQATLVGNIRIVQGESVGTCNSIIYDEPKNAAQLIGDVRFGNAKKQIFLADQITLFVDKGLIQTLGGARVTGPVENLGDAKPAPKPTIAFPEPAAVPDGLPIPPPEVEKFLPKPKTATTPAATATPGATATLGVAKTPDATAAPNANATETPIAPAPSTTDAAPEADGTPAATEPPAPRK